MQNFAHIVSRALSGWIVLMTVVMVTMVCGVPPSYSETGGLDLPLAKPKKKAPVTEAVPSAIEADIARAKALEKKNDFVSIVALLKPHTDVLPRSGLLVLARAYAHTDVTSEIRTLELCLAKNVRDYVVATQLGLALARGHRLEEAIATLREARSFNRKYPGVYDATFRVLDKMGDRYEARSVLNDKIKIFGGAPKDYSELCRLYSLDDFLEKAAEVCRFAIEKDPGNQMNYVHLGMSLRDLQKKDEAARVLRDGANRFPASEPIHTAAGVLKSDAKSFVEAYSYFKTAVAADPNSGGANAGLGASAFELQKNEEALNAFVRACKIDHKHTREFRSALAKLKTRKDTLWQERFENGLGQCL